MPTPPTPQADRPAPSTSAASPAAANPAASLSLFDPAGPLSAPAAGEAGDPVLLLPKLQSPYTLSRSRRRSIGFSVSAQGLRVTAPRWVPLADIEGVLSTKTDWIWRKWQEVQVREQRLAALHGVWREGAEVPYLGEPLRLRRSLGGSSAWTEASDAGPAGLALPVAEGADDHAWRQALARWLQAQARRHFRPRLDHFAERAGLPAPALRLSSARTRWGSA
ncbi:MAG: M48 family metallopeptidase, partial [Inhella sp.]